MIAEIYLNKIVIKQVWNTIDAQVIVRELCSILVEKGYRVSVYFTGNPVVYSSEGGLSIDIVLDRVLDKYDYELVKSILVNTGFEIHEYTNS